jgi:hypothetical protein
MPRPYQELYDPNNERKLEYTSPENNVFTPFFRVIPVNRRRKHKKFDFVEKSGTYVQDLGMRSAEIPLEIYFSGPFHIREAELFDRALAEQGPAKLVLPYDEFKTRTVVPLEWKRTTDMVEDVARTRFTVKFYETTQEFKTYNPTNDVSADIAKSSAEYTAAATEVFKENLTGAGGELPVVSKIREINNRVRNLLDFSAYVQPITDILEDVQGVTSATIEEFNATITSIDTNAANVFETPLVIASQIQSALTIPQFPQLTNLTAAYEALINSVSVAPLPISRGTSDILNVQALFGMSAVAAYAVKVSKASFQTRSEAVDALNSVKDTYEEFVEYLDEQTTVTESLPLEQRFTPDSAMLESLYELVMRLTGSTDAILADLQREVTYVAPQDTCTLAIAAEYYPDLFRRDSVSALETVERTNSFTGDQMVLVPKGTEFKVLI